MNDQLREVATKALNYTIACIENKEVKFDSEDVREGALAQMYAIREAAESGYIADEYIGSSIYTYAKYVIEVYGALTLIPIVNDVLKNYNGFKSLSDDVIENVGSLSRKFAPEELWYSLQMIEEERARIVLEADSYVFDECYATLQRREKDFFCKTVKQGDMYALSMRAMLEVLKVRLEAISGIISGGVYREQGLALMSQSALMQQQLLRDIEQTNGKDVDEEMWLQLYNYTNYAGMELHCFCQTFVTLAKIPPSLRRELIAKTNHGIYFDLPEDARVVENVDDLLEEASYLIPLMFKSILAEVHQYMATHQDGISMMPETVATQFKAYRSFCRLKHPLSR